jgi:hypothetical protein
MKNYNFSKYMLKTKKFVEKLRSLAVAVLEM